MRARCSNNDWGWRLVAYPIHDYEDPFHAGSKVEGAQVVESEHQYTGDAPEQYFDVRCPGARCMAIVFDNQTSLRGAQVRIYKEDPRSGSEEIWGEEYTGAADDASRNYPGTDGRPALRLFTDRCVVGFRTEGAQQDWGFRLVAYPSSDALLDWAGKFGRSTCAVAEAVLLLRCFGCSDGDTSSAPCLCMCVCGSVREPAPIPRQLHHGHPCCLHWRVQSARGVR